MTEQVKTDLEIFQQLDRVYSGEKEILLEEKMLTDQMEIDEMDLDDNDAMEIEPETTKNQNKISPSDTKNKKSAQGNIGDDFISFDFSEDEGTENNSFYPKEKEPEAEENEKKVRISNYIKRVLYLCYNVIFTFRTLILNERELNPSMETVKQTIRIQGP